MTNLINFKEDYKKFKEDSKIKDSKEVVQDLDNFTPKFDLMLIAFYKMAQWAHDYNYPDLFNPSGSMM